MSAALSRALAARQAVPRPTTRPLPAVSRDLPRGSPASTPTSSRRAALWATVEGTPEPLRGKLIASDPRYHTWALASRFLDAAAETHWQDSPGRVAACRLALAITERLPEGAYPPGLTQDLLARALGSLADALRLAHQLDAAGAALRKAGLALKRGTGDDLERAGLLRVGASVELASGDVAAAARLLRRAASVYRVYGDGHEEGRTLQRLALVLGHDDPAQGAGLARRALKLIDPLREPRCESRRPPRARLVFERPRPRLGGARPPRADAAPVSALPREPAITKRRRRRPSSGSTRGLFDDPKR